MTLKTALHKENNNTHHDHYNQLEGLYSLRELQKSC